MHIVQDYVISFIPQYPSVHLPYATPSKNKERWMGLCNPLFFIPSEALGYSFQKQREADGAL